MYAFFDLQAQYGGLIDRIDFGDKGCNMIVLWGAAVAYENNISRASNFVLDLQAQMDFPVTAGVTYYISHAGYIGGRLFVAYTCYSWGINLAARFMVSASQAEVWLDERITQMKEFRKAERAYADSIRIREELGQPGPALIIGLARLITGSIFLKHKVDLN